MVALPWKPTMVRDRRGCEEFLEGNDAFVRDESREKFILTFNPGGYLQKRETATGSASSSSLPPRSPGGVTFGSTGASRN